MASTNVSLKVLTGQGSDQNRVVSTRVRTTGTRVYATETNIADDNTSVTLWAADGGLGTFDFGTFQIDPFGAETDGASDAALILEVAGATYTIAFEIHLEVPFIVPGKITDDQDGTLEDVVSIKVKNTNADGVGDLRGKLALFGRSS